MSSAVRGDVVGHAEADEAVARPHGDSISNVLHAGLPRPQVRPRAPQLAGQGLQGLKGGKQQKCNICNRKCSWICVTCTKGPNALWPCHPETTRGRGKGDGGLTHHSCFAKHEEDPAWIPRVARRSAKRARGGAASEPPCSPCDADDVDDEIDDDDDDE